MVFLILYSSQDLFSLSFILFSFFVKLLTTIHYPSPLHVCFLSFVPCFLFILCRLAVPFLLSFWPHHVFQPYQDAAVVASCIASLHRMRMTSFPIKREVSSLHPYSRKTAIRKNTLSCLCHRTSIKTKRGISAYQIH